MTEVFPNEPIAFGYLGAARLAAGDRDGAQEPLDRAYALDPSYTYAASTLVEIALARGDLAQADRWLARWSSATPDPTIEALRLRLAARQGQHASAEASLKLLARLPGAPIDAARKALDSAVHLLGFPPVRSLVTEAARSDVLSGEFISAFVDLCGRRRRLSACIGLLDAFPTSGTGRKIAARETIETLGEKKDRALLGNLCRKYDEWFSSDDDLWGSVGYALTRSGRIKESIDWLRHYERHPNVQPWMLHNLAACLRVQKRIESALAVHRHALALAPDHTTHLHQLWIAAEEALSGDAARAAATFEALPEARLESWAECLLLLGRALVTVRLGEPEARAQAHKEACRFLNQAQKACPDLKGHAGLLHFRTRALRTIRMHAGGLSAVLHRLWPRLRTALGRRRLQQPRQGTSAGGASTDG
jgi:Tfp pilus assembly protein PilF